MKKLTLIAVVACFAVSPTFASVDFDNLPEPTKELCTDAKFMTDFSAQMQA
mgnify:FL=1